MTVSTDNVDTEIPSPVAGVLQEILVGEDETVAVGSDLAIIGSGAEFAPAPAPAADLAQADRVDACTNICGEGSSTPGVSDGATEDERYDVVLLKSDGSDAVVHEVARLTGLTAQAASSIVRGAPVRVLRYVDPDAALTSAAKLEELGAQVSIEPGRSPEELAVPKQIATVLRARAQSGRLAAVAWPMSSREFRRDQKRNRGQLRAGLPIEGLFQEQIDSFAAAVSGSEELVAILPPSVGFSAGDLR
jgi:pyruvate/2-oxoglutarate dehydrogenase complex dihydrolipoamide acyltransferase (E2) component